MPLVKLDIQRGKSEVELRLLLDTVHNSLVKVFKIPERDRYQIINQHEPYEMIIQDSGLEYKRSETNIVITILSKERDNNKKIALYQTLVDDLNQFCGINPVDIMIAIHENSNSDWSFGYGRAQFLTKDLI
ncbi:tautomerase family protein [Vagococcus sp. PNs007]|uniref:Tautomerase family protein n=1 Tax=Vagococcus proximus TaxID=2991417 RepID=A0ABT5X248_9ENTE|nr:tautomerase family protein [Vagococcus proximus]MDF0480066.1 tautomerase family protein [Vagococcus proximus]